MGQAYQRIAFFFAALLVCNLVHAQFNLGFEESFQLPFNQNGNLRLATVGGFSNPQFSEIDLNQDGLLDLFVFDRSSHTWRTFIYNSATESYDYAMQYESQFPDNLSNMVLLRDYNCDGNPDIFDYDGGAFRVHTCTAQNPWKFELTTEAIQSDYGSTITNAFLLPGDVPAIIDIDFDGDLDILAFGNGDSENTIVLHENQSQDEYGSCDSLEFIVTTECWGGFQEPSNGNTLEAIACRPEIAPPRNWQHQAARFHPGSTILFTDTDGDDDYDMALGDIQTTDFVFATNIGSAGAPEIDIASQTTDFPNGTNPVSMQYMVSGYNVDINHDGQKDLIATTNNTIDSSCNVSHIWSYENIATTGASYSLTTKEFLIGEMLDLGTGAVPLVIDVDNDGLEDILFANDFYRSPNEYRSSQLYYFRNTGSANQPRYTLSNEDLASLSQFDFQAVFPSAGDLDNDGDLDLIIGDIAGNLHYFRNDPIGGVVNFVLTDPNYMGINSIGQYAAPFLFDLNEDGLLDLLVGERIGTVAYFENSGTAETPFFSNTATIAKLGKVDVSPFCCNGYAAPQVIDQEEFGDGRYLFVGSDQKKVLIYEIKPDLNDSFALLDSITILADRLTPVFNDFDGDGVIEMLSGTEAGGVKYYDRSENFKVTIDFLKPLSPGITIYPNPANEMVQVKLDHFYQATITLLTVDGKICSKETTRDSIWEVDISSTPPGVYFIIAESDNFRTVRKLVVAR